MITDLALRCEIASDVRPALSSAVVRLAVGSRPTLRFGGRRRGPDGDELPGRRGTATDLPPRLGPGDAQAGRRPCGLFGQSRSAVEHAHGRSEPGNREAGCALSGGVCAARTLVAG